MLSSALQVLAKHHSMLRACLAASLCHLMGCSLPGPSVHRIVPAEMQGAAISSSGDLPEDPRIQPKQVSYRACIVGGLFTAEPPGKFCRVTGMQIRRIWFHVQTQTWNFQLEIWTNNFNFYFKCWIFMNAAFHVDFTLILCFVYCQDHLVYALQQRITEV